VRRANTSDESFLIVSLDRSPSYRSRMSDRFHRLHAKFNQQAHRSIERLFTGQSEDILRYCPHRLFWHAGRDVSLNFERNFDRGSL
jgi:hypothetical protein